MNNREIKNIVVVGGGTAGWLTAGRIAASYPPACGRDIRVTLVESPDVKPVGVGEGTWPTMRSTLMKLGISETDFIRCCDASFKQGARFSGWKTGAADDFYYHPLMLPVGFDSLDVGAGWCNLQAPQSFADALSIQEQLCERGLAPKHIRTPEYGAVANYAYHLDAGKFSVFLAEHVCKKFNVRHVLDHVTGVNSDSAGDIASVSTRKHGDLAGDLFVDCSGFASLLLAGHYQVPFVDRSDVLFIDQALAVQLPYEDSQAPIACHTLSTAQPAGWIWDIGLQSRRGIGYVYSSAHSSETEAEATLARYTGRTDLNIKKIPIHCGHREHFWHRNCVAVGLSAGFLEPLEASALVLVELSAAMIADQLPHDRQGVDIVANRFNHTFRYRWDRIIDFLKLHYMLSRRAEPFWRDNCDNQSIPDSLQELLHLWRHRSPANCDFTSTNEVFPAASYQYVLYGMGFRGQSAAGNDLLAQKTRQAMQKNREQLHKACSVLPGHRALIDSIHQFGLAAV